MKVGLENRLKTGMEDVHFNVVVVGLVPVNNLVDGCPFNSYDV